MMAHISELERKSIEYRRTILRIIKNANAGHTGGSLSCIDILNVLYNAVMDVSPENIHSPDRDRYIQSKGHSVEALYTVLASRDFFDPAELETLCRYQSLYVGHPTRKINGIEHNTGGLGHGLSVAVGLAIAGKMDRRAYRVFTLLGDGELAEGSNWEAAMTAAHYHLDNLTAIIDRNGLQISGRTEEVNGLEPLEEKWRAFGFAVRHVDGHDLSGMVDLLRGLPFEAGRPNLVIAHTVKGKGISFVENAVEWHHHVPNDEEYAIAMAELDRLEAQARISRGPNPPAPFPTREGGESRPGMLPGKQCCFTAADTGQHARPTEGTPSRVGKGLRDSCRAVRSSSSKPNLDVFAETLLEIARRDRDVVVVTSDSRGSARLTNFCKALPEQVVEVGIAEQNLVGVAAGLASAGKKVFAVSPACFLTARALEQIKNDIAYSNFPVKLVGISAGVSYGALGSTHHSLHDLAVLQAIPNIDIVVPADNYETREAITAAWQSRRPMYLRFGKRPMPDLSSGQWLRAAGQSAAGGQQENTSGEAGQDTLAEAQPAFEIGKARALSSGSDVTFIATGETVWRAAEAARLLGAAGISCGVISIPTVKPLDEQAVLSAAASTSAILTVEEHSVYGGLGSRCAALLMENGMSVRFKIVGIPDEDTVTGSQEEIFVHYGITPQGLAEKAKQTLEKPVSLYSPSNRNFPADHCPRTAPQPEATDHSNKEQVQ